MNLTVELNIRVLPFKDYYPIPESWLPEIINDTGTMLYFWILDPKFHFYFYPPMSDISQDFRLANILGVPQAIKVFDESDFWRFSIIWAQPI